MKENRRQFSENQNPSKRVDVDSQRLEILSKRIDADSPRLKILSKESTATLAVRKSSLRERPPVLFVGPAGGVAAPGLVPEPGGRL